MSLAVPEVLYKTTNNGFSRGSYGAVSASPVVKVVEVVDEFIVKYDSSHQEVILTDSNTSPVRKGDWIVLTTASKFI